LGKAINHRVKFGQVLIENMECISWLVKLMIVYFLVVTIH
jgi:hypothetical protein